MLLGSCTENNTTPASTPATGIGTGSTSSSSGDGKTTTDLYNFFKEMQKSQSASFNYTITSSSKIVEHTDYYNENYIVNQTDGSDSSQAYVLADSFDPEETKSEKIVYGGTLENDKFTLSSAAYTYSYDSSYNVTYSYVTSISSQNHAYLLGRKTSNKQIQKDDDGNLVIENVGWLQTLATAVSYEDAESITAGTAYFTYMKDDDAWEIDATLRVDGEDVELDPIYVAIGDKAKVDALEEIVADSSTLLGEHLTEAQIAPIVGDYTTYTTTISESYGWTQTLAYDRSHADYSSVSIHQTYNGQTSTRYFKGTSDSLGLVYLDSTNTIQTQSMGTSYNWSSFGDPAEVLNPKAFIKQSNGAYAYIGLPTDGNTMFFSMTGMSSRSTGLYYGGMAANVTGGVVTSFSYVALYYSSSGYGYTQLTTNVSNQKSDYTDLPTPLELDTEVENDLGEGLKKLTGTTTFKVTSSVSNLAFTNTSTSASTTNPGISTDLSSTYFYDATNKALINQSSYTNTEGTAVTTTKGWKETTTEKGATVVTPFKINDDDNSLQARNINDEKHTITDSYYLGSSLSSAFLEKVEGVANTYKFKFFNFEGLSTAILFGPYGYGNVVEDSIRFVTDGNGTLTSVTYDFSYSYSDTVTVSGTETLTYSFGASATSPVEADLSGTIAAFVKPTTWKEEDEDIHNNLCRIMTDAEATALPYYFLSDYHENWSSLYNSTSGIVTIYTYSTSDNAETFKTAFGKNLVDASWTSAGRQANSTLGTEIDYYYNSAKTYALYFFYSSNYVYICVTAYSKIFTTSTSSIVAIVPEKRY